MKDCCNHKRTAKKCRRKKDNKTFKLPRRFSKKKCLKGVKGFSMKSSCAPYKGCKKGDSSKKKSFLFNPNDPKKTKRRKKGGSYNVKCKNLLKKHGASLKTYKNGRKDIKFTKKKKKQYDNLFNKDFKKGMKILMDIKNACIN